MDLQEVTQRLQDSGCAIVRSQVSQKGRFVDLIQPWDVAMFHEDIADILSGRASLDDVINRNKGADLADPWAVA